MATRHALRFVQRRFSSSGKAAENVFIKKMEQEKLAKLALKGPKGEEISGVMTDKHAVVSGLVIGGGLAAFAEWLHGNDNYLKVRFNRKLPSVKIAT